jgi:nucleotide-binding universal stress UspA family protein
MYTRVCVAIDGSPATDHALAEALRMCEGRRADILLLSVVDVRVNAAEGVNFESIYKAWRDEGEQALDAAAATVRAASIEPELALVDTDGKRVARTIVEEAERWRADVIVIGTHGRSGFAHLLLGSVADQVIRSSPIPVLVVRGRNHPSSGQPL